MFLCRGRHRQTVSRAAAVQVKRTVKSDRHPETESRRADSSVSEPTEGQRGAGGTSGGMPQRSGQGTKESRPLGEEIHAVSLQQPRDHFFHGGVQMSKCQIKFGKQRAAGGKPDSFL